MFQNLVNTVKQNRDDFIKNQEKVKETTDGLDGRVTELESQIDILKSMSNNDDGSPGIFEMLQELRAQMRKDLDEKSNELLKRIEELEEATKIKDDSQQVEIDDLKLLADNAISNHEKNKSDIENLKLYKCDTDTFDQESIDVREMIQKMGTGQPIEIRAPTPK